MILEEIMSREEFNKLQDLCNDSFNQEHIANSIGMPYMESKVPYHVVYNLLMAIDRYEKQVIDLQDLLSKNGIAYEII